MCVLIFLREVKKALKPLHKIEIDVKDLSDIERPQMKWKKLPRYRFTARDVRTGGEWMSFGETKEGTNTAIFAKYLLSHLKSYGVNLSEAIIRS